MFTVNQNLTNSCRVCRSPNQDGDYQCLFENGNEHEEGSSGLSESGILYEKLLDISLTERNYYPKFLCHSCLLQMKLFIKLKDNALKTLQYLQNIHDGAVVLATEPIENTTNNNYESSEQTISINESQNCQGISGEYQLKVYDFYSEHEEFENIADETIFTSYQPVNVENSSYNEDQIELDSLLVKQQIANSVISNVETNFEGDVKVQTDSQLKRFITEIETDGNIFQQATSSEEQFPRTKLEPILDKNDYVTEIYELIDDECSKDEMYLESHEKAGDEDYSSFSELNTDTGSTYNDIEYLLEEQMDDSEDKTTPVGNENVVKRRKLSKLRSGAYKCLSCQMEFKNLHKYKSHRIESHNENFTCNTCSKEFRTVAALQKHIKVLHNDEPAFQCEICHKTFNQKVHYQYHMNYHNNIRNYKCDICEKAFIAKADLKTHLRLHTGERPYVCNICGKDYLMTEHLKAHLITHTDQNFSCEVCHKQFSTHKTLRLHVRTIHEDEPRFKCTFCLKPFRRKHHLEYHLRSHEKTFNNFELGGQLTDEPPSLEDMVEQTIDDPDFIYLM